MNKEKIFRILLVMLASLLNIAIINNIIIINFDFVNLGIFIVKKKILRLACSKLRLYYILSAGLMCMDISWSLIDCKQINKDNFIDVCCSC